MLQRTPINTPTGFAKGMNRAKKKRIKMGTVSRFTVFWVTALIFPGTCSMIALDNTMIIPIPTANPRANHICLLTVAGFNPKRSRKSVITTAVIEFTPESILDIAAANKPATTNPETTGGSS